MAQAPRPLRASVEIDAPVDEVWSVVSDLTRMPEWSPELRRLYVVGAGALHVGQTLVGINRRGYVAWPTRSTVVRLEPGRAVAWRTRESAATWSYELEDLGGRTRLTGRRDLADFSLLTKALGPLIGGRDGHDVELGAGLRSTLERIKVSIEARG